MRRETKTWAGRLFAAAGLAFVLAYLPYHLYARSGLARTLALRRDRAALRSHNRELAQENDRLARSDDGGVGLEEKQRLGRNLIAELGGVLAVVTAHAHHLAAGQYGCNQPSIGERDRLTGQLDRPVQRVAVQHSKHALARTVLADGREPRLVIGGEPGNTHGRTAYVACAAW